MNDMRLGTNLLLCRSEVKVGLSSLMLCAFVLRALCVEIVQDARHYSIS